MKILFVNEYASPVSGAEYSQNELAKAVNADCFSPKWFRSGLGRGITPLWFNNPIYYLYSALTICRQEFDLIHVHGKYILPGAIIAGWITRKPVVITVRDFKFLCPLALCFIKPATCSLKYFIKTEIPEYQERYSYAPKAYLVLAKLWQYQLKWWLNRAAKVIAVSPQLAQIYRDNGVKSVISVYNLSPEKQSQAKGKIILSVGKLSYGKGTDTVIKAARRLPEYDFIFAGELNPSLKADFPANCRYLGRITHKQALALYAKAGVFVINSRWPEPLSRAGLEALSFGLPIVASNCGGNQELVKDNGILVEPEDSEALARAIDSAFRHRREFSRNSFRLLGNRFNRNRILSRHRQLYEGLIK